MPPGGPGGIKRRSKRIYPEQETTRATRSKKSIAQPEANIAPSDICFPDPSPSHVNQVQEVGGDAIAQPDVNAHIFKCILTSCLFQMMALSFPMAAQPMEVKALQSLEEASVLEVKVISLFLFVC